MVPSALLFNSLPSACSRSADATGSRSSSVAVPGTCSRWRSWTIPRGIVSARLRYTERPDELLQADSLVLQTVISRCFIIHSKCSQRSTTEADMHPSKQASRRRTFQGRGGATATKTLTVTKYSAYVYVQSLEKAKVCESLTGMSLYPSTDSVWHLSVRRYINYRHVLPGWILLVPRPIVARRSLRVARETAFTSNRLVPVVSRHQQAHKRMP